MILLLIITGICLLISFIADWKKSLAGIKKGMQMFLNLLPTLLSIIILISVALYLTPADFLARYMGKNAGIEGYLFAALIGSVSLIPGFIAYPVAGILIKNGVSYPVIAVFITTLMMVGVLTLPVEKKYFGLKVAVIRNIFGFAGAIIVGFLIGLLWKIL